MSALHDPGDATLLTPGDTDATESTILGEGTPAHTAEAEAEATLFNATVGDAGDTVLNAHWVGAHDDTILVDVRAADSDATVLNAGWISDTDDTVLGAPFAALADHTLVGGMDRLPPPQAPVIPSIPPVPTAAEPDPAPGLPALRVEITGLGVFALDDALILGRSPRSARVRSGALPTLIAVPSPAGEISGSHLRLWQEGQALLAEDLHSANGTMLLVPGGRSQRLRAGIPVVVLPGSVLDLGEGIRVGTLPARAEGDA